MGALKLLFCCFVSLAVLHSFSLGQQFRVQITVGANGYDRTDKPVESEINFTQLLAVLGAPGSFNPHSIRVQEVNVSGGILDAQVEYQFDRDSTFHPITHARGTLTFLMKSTTPASTQRFFRILFDTSSAYQPPAFSARVALADSIQYQGQQSYRITTELATYYYHKLGGGFASMIDLNNNDWISYRPGGGSAGEYRGIPNLGVCAHPGYTNATSNVVLRGPLKISILSRTTDNGWSWQWDMFPRYARMTLTKRASTYWILYEGTPGGQLDASSDFWVRSSGERLLLSQGWFGDIPAPEWVYFGDRNLRRVLYLAHHEDDALQDIFYQMENNMTVFGFGRQWTCCGRYLTQIPTRLTIGFAEDSLTAAQTINGAFADLTVTLGTPMVNAVAEHNSPLEFWLDQNYPNPFNPETTIRFGVAERSHTVLKVFDILGREMDVLISDSLEPGMYEANVDASRYSSGVYLYSLTSNSGTLTKKMVVMK